MADDTKAPKEAGEIPCYVPSRRAQISLEKVEIIAKWIEAGNAETVSAQANGIGERTFHRWVQRGRDARRMVEAGKEVPESEHIYIALYDRVEIARAKAIGRNIQIIQEAAKFDAKHAEWWLKFNPTSREFYGEVHRLEHSGPGGQPIETRGTIALTDITKLTAVIAANTEDDESGDGSGNSGTD